MRMEQMIRSASVYKLAILIGFMFSINALCLSVISGLAGVDVWGRLTATQQMVIVATMVANWTNTMMAFFNKTLSRIEQGKSLAGHDTDPPFKLERRAP